MATYNKKNVEDVVVSGKTVLVRCDFNVPMKDGVITSDKRIVSALPTIKYLLENGAKVILCSHMGKPHAILTEGFGLTKKEKKAVEKLPEAEQAQAKAEYLAKAPAADKKKLTLKPVAARLNELLGKELVTFAPLSRRYLMVGSAPTILLSEVITPSFIGTLKSQRTSTVLPATATSSIVFLL